MTIAARFRLDYPGFCLDVDLTLPGSGITAIFGPSGSGKTTLLRAVAGLEHVPGGRLVVGSETWQDEMPRSGYGEQFLPTHRRPLGYVFQEASLFPHLNVRGNLDFGMQRSRRQPRRPASADFSGVVDLLGIAPLLDRQPDTLSGGERQRVAIARALLTAPRLLLMDEPLAALDLARKQEILPYLERLHDELEIPVLYVSHAPDEVARLADHLVALDGGRAVATGPLAETLARVDLPIKLGEDAGVVLAGRIAERDAQWHLARVDCAGTHLWVRDAGHAIGQRVRVRILARDVSLARTHATDSSILNILPAKVIDIGAEPHPSQVLVKLDSAGTPLLSRITHRSADALALAPGVPIYAQIKAVALIA